MSESMFLCFFHFVGMIFHKPLRKSFLGRIRNVEHSIEKLKVHELLFLSTPYKYAFKVCLCIKKMPCSLNFHLHKSDILHSYFLPFTKEFRIHFVEIDQFIFELFIVKKYCTKRWKIGIIYEEEFPIYHDCINVPLN